MELKQTALFEKDYRKLSKQDQERVGKALAQFAQNPLHPSLRVARLVLKGRDDIWSFRASSSLRCTFQFDGDRQALAAAEVIVLRRVDAHHAVYRNP